MENIVSFVKKHKVVVGIGTAVVCGVILYLAKGRTNTIKIKTTIYRSADVLAPSKLDAPDALAKFGVSQVDEYTGAFECMTAYSPNYSVSIGDLGTFGEALCELDGITADSKAFALINIAKS